MNKEDLMKLAESIKNKTATKEEKIQFFQALNSELKNASDILSKSKNKK